MKTIREWLEELPEPYRTQALENTPELYEDLYAPSLKYAIEHAFYWVESEQGMNYWDDFVDTLNSPHGT